jgi:hypothetical protein
LTFTAKPLWDLEPFGPTTGGPLRRELKNRAQTDKPAPTRNRRVKLKRLTKNMPRMGDTAREKFTARRQ